MRKNPIILSAVMSLGVFAASTASPAPARAESVPATRPADASRVTGTGADIKGTSNTIGGRDVPAPRANSNTGANTGNGAPAAGSGDRTDQTDRKDTSAAPAAPASPAAPVDVAAPADHPRITGTGADIKGSSNTVGGRDIPAPGAAGTAAVGTADSSADHSNRTTPSDGEANRSNTPKAIQDLLASTVNDAANDGHFKDVVSHLAQDDRDRIAGPKAPKVETGSLDEQVVQFRKDWKARYHEDFHIGAKNESMVFNNVTASPSAAGEARTAGAVLTDHSAATPANQSRVTGSAADIKGTANTIGGRDVPAPAARSGHDAASSEHATASERLAISFVGNGESGAAAGAGSAAGTVPVVREGDQWKIDAPDSLSGAGLRTRLSGAFSRLGSDKANWPNDVNDAYRVVADQVLTAITTTGQAE